MFCRMRPLFLLYNSIKKIMNANKGISLNEFIETEQFQNSNFRLPIVIGRVIYNNENKIVDLRRLPHVLIAGASGYGKTTFIHSTISSLLHKKNADELKFILINTVNNKFSIYKAIQDYYFVDKGIISDVDQAVATINSLCQEMENRINAIKESPYSRNIEMHNEESKIKMPYIVCIIENFDDIIEKAGKRFEMPLTRLAELSARTGIHLIITTNKVNEGVISNSIINTFPCKISFYQNSKLESYQVILSPHAHMLKRVGHLFFQKYPDSEILQGALISNSEILQLIREKSTQNIQKSIYTLPKYQDIGDNDLAFDTKLNDAVMFVVDNLECYPAAIQRGLSVGYNRAGRIIQQLELLGVVGENTLEGRRVLIKEKNERDEIIEKLQT